jgi:small GTP-binding protein
MVDNNITCKVVLVGDSGVGKTCIIQRYVNNDYNENTESTSTSTYSYKTLDFKQYNKSISLDIWDTAGQELYRALAKNFYLNASIGILVYDIRRKESFESIKDYWYEQVKTSGEENMVFGVVGNKCDLFQEEKVSEDEGKKFAKEIGAVFQLTSCKENIGIDELFQQCAQKFMESNNLATFTEQKKNDNIKLDSSNKNNNNGGNTQKRRFC